MMNWSAKDGARSSLHYGGRRRFHPPIASRCVQTARYGRAARDPRRPRTVLGWHSTPPHVGSALALRIELLGPETIG